MSDQERLELGGKETQHKKPFLFLYSCISQVLFGVNEYHHVTIVSIWEMNGFADWHILLPLFLFYHYY